MHVPPTRTALAVLCAGALILSVSPLRGQSRYSHDGTGCPPAPCPAVPLPQPQPAPAPAAPTPAPAPAPTGPSPAPSEAAAPSTDLALDQRFGGVGGETVARSDVGYIDSAIPQTQLRFRYDAGFEDNRPDRAEFFYPKCGCLALLPPTNPLFDPRAPGPAQQPRFIDFQEQTSYLEVAYNRRLSGFVEIPVRFIDFDQRVDSLLNLHSNLAGLSDVNFGVKYALLADEERYLTGQLRTFAPTGDADRGLGTDHWSLEPALLFYQRLSDRLTLEAELRDWIPLGGTDFAGNVLRYGVGLGCAVYDSHSLRIVPVAEVVGWTVLSGKEIDENVGTVFDARGDTIVNIKTGVRTFFGAHSDAYVGYGRALTGEVWYKDILRVEYRLRF